MTETEKSIRNSLESIDNTTRRTAERLNRMNNKSKDCKCKDK